MQELEKILAEIDNLYVDETDFGIECNMENRSDIACDNCYECIKEACKNIIRKHMNDGWIPVEKALTDKEGAYLVTYQRDKKCEEFDLPKIDVHSDYFRGGIWLDNCFSRDRNIA